MKRLKIFFKKNISSQKYYLTKREYEKAKRYYEKIKNKSKIKEVDLKNIEKEVLLENKDSMISLELTLEIYDKNYRKKAMEDLKKLKNMY